jgi:hypothetical protein
MPLIANELVLTVDAAPVDILVDEYIFDISLE